MKKICSIISLVLISIFSSCSTDKTDVDVAAIAAPKNIDALFTIAQDNSGKVTITPTGEGITQFKVYYGDATADPAQVNAGGNTAHTYLEGTYQVKVVGTNLNGQTAEVTLPLSVTFFAPTDLAVTITPITTNSLGFTVKATANFETAFLAYFGESPTETPVVFHEGDVISHIYPAAGNYTIKVVAITGGQASTQYTQIVTASTPTIIAMPLDFESTTLNYVFTNFGGTNTLVAANPHVTGIDVSSKVGALNKTGGAQTWAGSFIELSSPIDFSVMKKIKMKVWCPQTGIVVKMKLENFNDNTINSERDANVTTANGWQELTFDFTGISLTNTYQRVVVFFDFGVAGNGTTYYFDDIKQSN